MNNHEYLNFLDIPYSWGQRLEALHRSRADLAAELGIDRKQLHRWIVGETSPRLSSVAKVEQALARHGSAITVRLKLTDLVPLARS